MSYQGADTIRPHDNGGLCGGGAFETKGCAENDCSASSVNTGGSDGIGSNQVTIQNVRVNDYYRSEDEGKIGAPVAGNYNCSKGDGTKPFAQGYCCFCKPNGIRASQVAVWVRRSILFPQLRLELRSPKLSDSVSERCRPCRPGQSCPQRPGPVVSERCDGEGRCRRRATPRGHAAWW